jgi:PAS domain S-box-containing protein
VKIRTQILLTVAAVALLPLLILGFLAYRYSHRRLEQHADQNLIALGRRMASEVDAFAYRALEEIRTDSLIPSLASFLTAAPAERTARRAELLELLRSAVIQDPVNVTSCALVDRAGRNLLDTSSGQEGNDESGLPWFQLITRQELPVIFPETDAIHASGVLWVEAPVRDTTGRILGFLREKYELATLQQIIQQLTTNPGSGTFAVVMDAKGFVLAHGANAGAIGQPSALPADPATGLVWARVSPLANGGGPLDRAAIVVLDHVPWRVAVMQTEPVFHQTLSELRRTMTLLAVLMALLGMVAAYVVAGRLSRPIRLLAHRAEQLGRNDDTPVQTASTSAGEVETLTRTFDDMSVRLRTTLADLEQRVDELKASDERLRRLIEFSPVAMTVRDMQDRTILVNRRYTELFGYTLEDVPDITRWFELAYPDPAYRTEVAERRTISLKQWEKTGAINTVEALVTCRDGSRKHIEFHSELLGDRYIVSFVDLTEHKRLEEQLRQSQKMEAIGTLAGGIAHDFNNILTGIYGNTQLVHLDLPPDHPVQPMIQATIKASLRARDLVKQILTFSRHDQLDLTPKSLEPVIREALDLLRASLSTSIEIRAEYAPDCPSILCDSTQIHQIIMNLGTNAAHAMRERGGTLSIQLRAVKIDEGLRSVHPQLQPHHTVCLSLRDTGTGMDAATRQRIFEPFFTTKRVGEGTGMGLAVVHGILQNLDGAIVVESAPGVGTAFHLYFPSATSSAQPEATKAPFLTQGQGQHILLVDDEPMVAGVAERMLRHLGYTPHVFNDAAGAIAALHDSARQFDGIISDLHMPGSSGLEVARMATALRPGLVFVLATGNTRALDQHQARAAGISHFVEKPYSIESLGELLHRALAAAPRQS